MTNPNTAAIPSRAQQIAAIASRIGNLRTTTGARASLRRGTRHDVARQAAFHALLMDIPDEHISYDLLERWAAVVQCAAITGGSVDRGESDGKLLARAGLSEARFARLLASHGDGLFDQMLMVSRFVHSKDFRPGWMQLGELLLTDEISEYRADAVRLQLARDYYRTLNRSAVD